VTKLIYIGGYGHSGSTLLEYLMTGCPAVMACGEVSSCIRERAGKQRACSCGRVATDCPVWSFFFASDDATPWSHVRLASALAGRAEGHYSAIVDSSKTAWGSLGAPFRMKRKFGSEFILVHLVREPAAVCWSVFKQKNLRAERLGRRLPRYATTCGWTALGWWFANLSCELFGRMHPRQYICLRYEDLARSPATTLPALFEQLLPNAPWHFGEAQTPDNRHQLHGNNARFRALKIEDVREDCKWKTEMPVKYAKMVASLTHLLRLRYGYSGKA
jgi:hypothetical protein